MKSLVRIELATEDYGAYDVPLIRLPGYCSAVVFPVHIASHGGVPHVLAWDRKYDGLPSLVEKMFDEAGKHADFVHLQKPEQQYWAEPEEE